MGCRAEHGLPAATARALGGALALVLLAWSGRGEAAPDKRACLGSYVDAQSMRQEGKLLAARAAAVTCGSDACPAALRGDCVTWLRELDAATPSVVLSATGPDGRDVSRARVSVDGKPAGESLTGEPVTLDPGEHVLACESAWGRVETRIVAAEGAKNRPVHFTFTEPAGADVATASPPGRRPVPLATYVLGAVGIVSLGVWATVGASAFWGSPGVESLGRCSPLCSTADRQDVEGKLEVADIAGAAALITLGGAAVFYFMRPVVLTPSRGGVSATWTTSF